MAIIVDKLVEGVLGCSHIDMRRVDIVSRGDLSKISKRRDRSKILLPGEKAEREYFSYVLHAMALASFCGDLAKKEGDICVGIMFRDSDGTNTAERERWSRIVEAIADGYRRAGFPFGVVMVPRPKQEAWIMCGKKKDPYISCADLEYESGNDASPNSLKKQLAEVCGGEEPTVEEMNQWICDGVIDIDRIDMPSFLHFRQSLTSALFAAVQQGGDNA
jgi:hypothetical protein